jgi:PAS domain S-box-containing protein
MIVVDAPRPNALAFEMAAFTSSSKLASDRQTGGLRSILNAVPVEVMSFDGEHRLVEFNSAVQQANPWADVSTWIGKTFEEILRESVDHFRAGDPHRDWNAWMEARFEQFRTAATRDVQRPHGDWRRVHFVPTEDGGRLLIRLDITELKEREEMLAASERRYAELVDALPDGVVSIASDGCVEYASRVALDVLGRSASDTIGKRLLSLVSEADAPRLGETLERVRTAGAESQTVVCEVLRGGEPRQMQFTLKRSRGAEGAIGGLIRDVHEQQALTRKSDAELEQLTSIFQSTGAYFLMLDRDERIVMINQALRDMRGYGDREMAGTPYRDLGHAAGLTRDTVEGWQAASGPARLEPIEYESKTVDAAGNARILKITATPVQDKEGRLRYIVLVGIDDTQRRQAEIRLFDASRLANLGEMASGIAHEINQPLAVIRLAADALIEEIDTPESAADPAALHIFMHEKLGRIAAQTERASGIIRELRTVARKPSNDAQPFDLSDCARVGDDLLHEQLRTARVLLELDLPQGPGPRVRGEASRLQQVIINLALNARDAIVGRETQPMVGPLGHVILRVGKDQSGRHAVLTVEDNGPGIPDSVLPRLFQPFFTTKPAGKGTGLGLSISYDIVRRMGGEITADNRPEGGARFRITLPLLS